ncbi:MAG: transcription termination/antitermination NusG family protein [Anaerolineales bacterium]
MVTWYALRSKPRKEDALAKLARQRGHTLYYPRIRVNPVNPRARTIRPFFPGYMFVHTDLADVGMGEFQWMPFSLGLVCHGNTPVPIMSAVVDALKSRIGEMVDRRQTHYLDLEPGDRVRVKSGPLAGFDGVFEERLSGSDRVKILLALLHDRFVNVDISEMQLEK